MVWGAIAGLAASAAASYYSAKSAKATNADEFNYTLALQDHQNKWMEHMSNTAHQREVEDLRKAGLNPILSATGGNGASTPQAGSSTFDAIDAGNSALQVAMQKKSLRQRDTELEQAGNRLALDAETAHTQNSYTLSQTRAQNINNEFAPKLQHEQLKLLKAQQAQAIAGANSALATANATNRLLPSQIASNNANTAKSGAEASLQATEYARYVQWAKEHPYQAKMTYGLKQWTNSLGFGSSASYSKSGNSLPKK